MAQNKEWCNIIKIPRKDLGSQEGTWEMAFEQILEGIVCMQKHVQRPCGGNMLGISKKSK